MYKILISGSREVEESEFNISCLAFSLFTIAREKGGIANLEVISGGARGIDTLARRAANRIGAKFTEVPADWKKHGRAAGPIRNRVMLDLEPDVVWAFPVGKSVGTRDCIRQAERRGIPVITANTKEYFEEPDERRED